MPGHSGHHAGNRSFAMHRTSFQNNVSQRLKLQTKSEPDTSTNLDTSQSTSQRNMLERAQAFMHAQGRKNTTSPDEKNDEELEKHQVIASERAPQLLSDPVAPRTDAGQGVKLSEGVDSVSTDRAPQLMSDLVTPRRFSIHCTEGMDSDSTPTGPWVSGKFQPAEAAHAYQAQSGTDDEGLPDSSFQNEQKFKPFEVAEPRSQVQDNADTRRGAEQQQSPLSLHELNESIKALHTEVSRMSLSMCQEMGEMRQSMQQIIRKEFNGSLKSHKVQPQEKQLFPAISVGSVLESRELAPAAIAGSRAAQEYTSEQRTLQCQVSGELSKPLLEGMAQDLHREGRKLSKEVEADSQEQRKSSRGRSLLKVNDCVQQDSVKELLESALVEDQFNVEDLYSETGLWQSLARHDSWFSDVSLVMVAANLIWLGIDEDINHADVLCKAPLLSQVMNNIFCTWFVFEMMVHFLAFDKKINAFHQGRFLFDLILTLFMMWETWIEVFLYLVFGLSDTSNSAFVTQLFRLFRLFRLTQVPRIVRLSLYVPELMFMIKGMATAMRSVIVMMGFLFFTIFVFGIVFAELFEDIDAFKESFGSVSKSMYTLMSQVLCGPDTDFLDSVFAVSVMHYAVYLIFLFIATFTLLNMLIGVLCDVISNVRQAELDNIHVQHLDYEINQLVQSMDMDNDGSISKDEWEKVMHTKEAVIALDAVGVDVASLSGLQEFIFKDTDELSLSEFVQLIAQFRGSRVVTVKDLVDTHKFISMEIDALESVVKDALDRQLAHVQPRSASADKMHYYIPE